MSDSEARAILAEGEHFGKDIKRSTLERGAIEGNSPVLENNFTLLAIFLEYLGERTP